MVAVSWLPQPAQAPGAAAIPVSMIAGHQVHRPGTVGVMRMGSQELDWQRVTDEAVRILTCEVCTAGSTEGLPQPFWVGAAYRPGGVVLVARNPASKPLPEDVGRLLERLRAAPGPAGFAEWSTWRIGHMIGKPWTQWQRAFAKAVAGCWQPDKLAWLNLVPARSVTTPRLTPASVRMAVVCSWCRC
jgi:hypothetical protein